MPLESDFLKILMHCHIRTPKFMHDWLESRIKSVQNNCLTDIALKSGSPRIIWDMSLSRQGVQLCINHLMVDTADINDQ